MKIPKRIWPVLGILLALGLAFEAADRAGVHNVPGFVAPAEAVVGRPLTPVSYACVARRTARRCAGGVYYC
jgi:uncharacterized MnhB-related membrane protein